MRVAADVGPLELAEYQQAARLVLRHPLITASYPDRTALPLARKWARQLRTDFGEILGYTLVSTGETIRLRIADRTCCWRAARWRSYSRGAQWFFLTRANASACFPSRW